MTRPRPGSSTADRASSAFSRMPLLLAIADRADGMAMDLERPRLFMTMARLTAGEKYIVEALRGVKMTNAIDELHNHFHNEQIIESWSQFLWQVCFCFCSWFVKGFVLLDIDKDRSGKLELGGNQVLRSAMYMFPRVKDYFVEEELMSADDKIGKRVEALLWYCHTSDDMDVK